MVHLILAFRRGLSGAPVPQELEPVSGTIVVDPCWEWRHSPPVSRTLAQGHQQCDKAAARNVAFRPPGGAATVRRQGRKGWVALVRIAGCTDRSFAPVFR